MLPLLETMSKSKVYYILLYFSLLLSFCIQAAMYFVSALCRSALFKIRASSQSLPITLHGEPRFIGKSYII